MKNRQLKLLVFPFLFSITNIISSSNIAPYKQLAYYLVWAGGISCF